MRNRIIYLVVVALAVVGCRTATAGPTVPQTDPGLEAPRVVSLSPTHTEMIYAIGAENLLVGVDQFSDHPPAAGALPRVDAFNFNVEEVAALDPDLVVLAFDFNDEVAQLAAIGIDSLLLPPAEGLSGAYDQFLAVGEALGHPEEASTAVAAMREEIDAIIAGASGGEGLTFFHEIDDQLFSVTSGTFLGDIYSKFGLVNIADAVPDEFGSGFPQLSAEAIIAANPDVIFLGDAGFGVTADTVSNRPGWSEIQAVQAGNVVALDPDIAGRWGPRTLDLVRQIAAAIEEIAG